MELGIRIEKLGIVLVMRPGVAEIAEIAPRSLLDGEGSLFQMRRIGARAQDQICPLARAFEYWRVQRTNRILGREKGRILPSF